MTGKICLTRDHAGRFDDAMLQRVAKTLKAEHGLLARIPESLHAFAAQEIGREARALALSTKCDFLTASDHVVRERPHLLYLVTALIVDDDDGDITIDAEGA